MVVKSAQSLMPGNTSVSSDPNIVKICAAMNELRHRNQNLEDNIQQL